jgi:hypothetical protein
MERSNRRLTERQPLAMTVAAAGCTPTAQLCYIAQTAAQQAVPNALLQHVLLLLLLLAGYASKA